MRKLNFSKDVEPGINILANNILGYVVLMFGEDIFTRGRAEENLTAQSIVIADELMKLLFEDYKTLLPRYRVQLVADKYPTIYQDLFLKTTWPYCKCMTVTFDDKITNCYNQALLSKMVRQLNAHPMNKYH